MVINLQVLYWMDTLDNALLSPQILDLYRFLKRECHLALNSSVFLGNV